MTNTIKRLLISFLACVFFAQPAFAGGLSTPFGEVLVENLPIGRDYSLEKEAKTPLVVNNTSGIAVSLKIEILTPQESELKEGFQPIPDVSWVKLSQTEFVVEPGEAAKTDVIISIPDKEKYRGGKYQVFIWSHTVGRAVGVGLKSKLLFTVEQKTE
jgi:hypothetical protein